MARKAASTISDRTFLRCSRQRSLRASTFTPGSSPERGLDPRRTRSLYRPDVADLLRPCRGANDYRSIRAASPGAMGGNDLGTISATADRRDEIHDAAIRPGHRRWRAFGFGGRMAGRADRREGRGPGQGRVPARQTVRRRPDRARGQLSAEDGPGRRGRHVPPGQPGDGVQPEPVGAVLPEAARDARPRAHRQPYPPGHACCSSTPSRRAPRCARAPR